MSGSFGHQVDGGELTRLFFACSMCAETLWDGLFLTINEVSGSLVEVFVTVSDMVGILWFSLFYLIRYLMP